MKQKEQNEMMVDIFSVIFFLSFDMNRNKISITVDSGSFGDIYLYGAHHH